MWELVGTFLLYLVVLIGSFIDIGMGLCLRFLRIIYDWILAGFTHEEGSMCWELSLNVLLNDICLDSLISHEICHLQREMLIFFMVFMDCIFWIHCNLVDRKLVVVWVLLRWRRWFFLFDEFLMVQREFHYSEWDNDSDSWIWGWWFVN